MFTDASETATMLVQCACSRHLFENFPGWWTKCAAVKYFSEDSKQSLGKNEFNFYYTERKIFLRLHKIIHLLF